MSRKRESKVDTTPAKAVSRRQMLEGLGALAAVTACGSTSDRGTLGGAAGSPGGAGAANNVAGAQAAASPGAAGAGAGAPGAAGAGAGAPGVAGAPAGGAPAAAGAAGAPAGGAAGAAGAGGMGSTSMLSAPPWTAVPVQDSSSATPKALACNAVTKTDGAGQGPFFIHELEKPDDISLVRQDIRGQYNPAAEKGVDMELYVRLIDAKQSDAACGKLVPVKDIDVYIWHTDGQGYYSGFGKKGSSTEQKPDTPYAGSPNQNDLENADRFCRGVQVTDADGVAAFLSTFPGWYNGRDLHIHIVCFKKGSMAHGRAGYANTQANCGQSKQTPCAIEPAWIFTTQFYFDPAFSKSVHEAVEPYKRRTTLSAYVDAMAANEGGNSGRHCTATKVGNKVVAQIQMIVDPT